MKITPAHRHAYAIEVRMLELFEARGIEAHYWPFYDDEVRAQAQRELGEYMAFDPAAHLMQIKGKDYLEVKWRLVWFRERFPNGRITTTEMQIDIDAGYARFSAFVDNGEGGVASGTGTEYRKNMPVGMGDEFLEKAETRAIGRALAALGVGTQFVGEELSEGGHIADAPVEEKVRKPRAVPQKELAGASQPMPESAQQGVGGDTPTAVSGLTKTDTTATGQPSKPADKPKIEEAHDVLGRRPIESLSHNDCCHRLSLELRRLVGSEQDATTKQHRADVLMSVFGTGIKTYDLACGQGKSTLQKGLITLAAMQPEHPPASGEEDVPTFPPPDGNHREGPQPPPGDTLNVGPIQGEGGAFNGEALGMCATFEAGTNIRCARVALHDGPHYFAPPRPEAQPQGAAPQVTLPDKPLVTGDYISTSDVRIVELWAEMQGEHYIFLNLTKACKHDTRGNLLMTEALWERVVNAVKFMISQRVAETPV